MNENPEMASTWKGRILIQVECADSDRPEMKVMEIERGIKQNAIDGGYFEDETYDIIAEVG